MATITGYDKEKMDEINNSTVIGGHITGGHLILERRDGGTIDAGSVIGPQGTPGVDGSGFVICTHATRPSWGSGDEGKAIYETDTNITYIWNGTAFVDLPGIIPIGGVIPYFSSLVMPEPTGMWQIANGQLLNIGSYPTLYSMFGTGYGGDGINTFGIPDLRDKMIAGKADTVNIGTTGGAKTVTLTTAQMPTHTHDASPAGEHSHGPSGGYQFMVGLLAQSTMWLNTPTLADHTADVSNTGRTDTAANHDHAISNAGGSAPHENMPPYIVANYLMRCK